MRYILLLAAGISLLFSGCATTNQTAQFLSPDSVQSDVTAAASVAKPYLTAQEIADVTSLKSAALQLANGTLPIVAFQQLITNKVPQKDAPAFALVLAGASALFSEVYNYYGLGNSQFTSYCTHFANGLAAAGF